MRLRNLLLIAAMIAFATPALAAVKVYNATPPNGTPGDSFLYTTTLCPPIELKADRMQGSFEVTDTGGGSATLTDFSLREVNFTDLGTDALTVVFGPGAFVFVTATPTISISTLPKSATGATAPAGSVAWGVISGFEQTGIGFCISSPQTICTGGATLPHGVTSPVGAIDSPTYDLGTWSFDAEGDLSTSQYIIETANGGTTNRQYLIRGAYVGASIPALPLIGAGALAIGLAIAGTRSILRKK